MIIKEAFQQFLGVDDVDSKAIDLALLNAGLDGQQDYDASFKGRVESGAIDLIFQLYTVVAESESQYSTSKDAKLMRDRLLYLARKYGRKDIEGALIGRVTVKDISRIR